MATISLLRVTNEITECDCCGKKDLIFTAVLRIGKSTAFYGSDCASKALGRDIRGRREWFKK